MTDRYLTGLGVKTTFKKFNLSYCTISFCILVTLDTGAKVQKEIVQYDNSTFRKVVLTPQP